MPASTVETAQKIFDEAMAAVADERGVRAETLSLLLGTFVGVALFRKHNPATPSPELVGTLAFNADVEKDAPRILTILHKLSVQGGCPLAMDTALSTPIPDEYKPPLSRKELIARHGGRLWRLLEAAGHDPEERIIASVFAALLVLKHTMAIVPLSVHTSLILDGFVHGAKTWPPLIS